jgi:hypothetical protein
MSQSLFVARRKTSKSLSGTTFGELDISLYEHFSITTTGAATATLPAGRYTGQIISIALVVDGGDLVVSGDFQVALVTATFADAGDILTLRWVDSDGWSTLSNIGAVVLA